MGNKKIANGVQTPLARAFRMGYQSFQGGRFGHPFEVSSMQAKEWQRGFDKAYFENIEYRRVHKWKDWLEARNALDELTITVT